jgi:acyl-coenzyme A thioesterase 13
MSDHAIGSPSRKLDEFEELVYEYTSRMCLGNEGVSAVRMRNLHK